MTRDSEVSESAWYRSYHLAYGPVFFLSARFHSDEENRKKTKDRKPTLIDIVPRLSRGEGPGGGLAATRANVSSNFEVLAFFLANTSNVAINKLYYTVTSNIPDPSVAGQLVGFFTFSFFLAYLEY
jgi:hypothetical protein